MQRDAATSSPSPTALAAALTEYFAAPGRHQLTRRQPAILFASIREVLQIASDRGQSGEAPPVQRAKVREAARFFVRAALLYPGADHYSLLGYERASQPADLKDRYRLLMRLIHPDFARPNEDPWPVDAAVRVNRAYEVLSSPVLRREYDEQLAIAPRQQTPAKAQRHLARQPVARRIPRLRLRAGVAWAIGIALSVPAILLLLPRQEPAHLVQRRSVAVQPAEESWIRLRDGPAAPAPGSAEQRTLPAPVPEASDAHDGRVRQDSIPAVPPTQGVDAIAAGAPAARLVPPPQGPARAAAGPDLRVLPAAGTQPIERAGALQLPVVPAASAVPPATAMPAAAPAGLQQKEPEIRHAVTAPEVRALLAAASAVAPAGTSPAPPPLMAKARPTAPMLTMADVQPHISLLLETLGTGRGDRLLELLDADARARPEALALSRQYEQLITRGRPVGVSHVQFASEQREGVLLVTGSMRLHLGDPTIGSVGQPFQFRAEFAQRGDLVRLTGLSGAEEGAKK